RELAAQFRQVDKAVDRPQQMISRHMSIEREVVEQHTLFDLPWSHHRLSSCLSTGLNQWTFTVSTSAFFNKIGPNAVFKRFLHYVRYHPNSGAKADIPALRIWATKRNVLD